MQEGSEPVSERPSFDGLVELLLQAVTWVLGLQAWRAALLWLGAGGPRLGLCLVLFCGLWLTRWLAEMWGTRRCAAILTMLLALLRWTVQFGGPETVVWFAIGGLVLFAGSLDLQAMHAQPQRFVQGLLLGYGLVLTDRLLSGGYDLFWQPGGRPVTMVTLLLVPGLAVAVLAALGPRGARPAPTPLTVFLPLAVPFVQMGLAHPVLTARTMATGQPRVGVLLAVAALLASVLVPLLQWWYALSLRRRSWRRSGYRTYSTGLPALAAAVGAGLVIPPLHSLTLLLGPLYLGLASLAPAAARPIGRVRWSAGWVAPLGWWLAAVLSYLAASWPAMLVVSVAGLAGVALLAQGHPDRTQPRRPSLWPVLGLAPLVLMAILAATRAELPPAGMRAELADRGIRVATVDLSPADALEPQRLARQGKELRALGARLVLVREATGDGSVFWDGSAWLARRLGLNCYRPPGADGRFAVLCEAHPETLLAVEPDLMVATWRLEKQTFGVALCTSQDGPPPVDAAVAALAGLDRAVLAGSFGRRRPPLEMAPARHLASGSQPAVADAFWLSRGVQAVDVEPVVEVAETGATALLLVMPRTEPYRRD